MKNAAFMALTLRFIAEILGLSRSVVARVLSEHPAGNPSFVRDRAVGSGRKAVEAERRVQAFTAARSTLCSPYGVVSPKRRNRHNLHCPIRLRMPSPQSDDCGGLFVRTGLTPALN